jgi:hypothetical protein
MDMEIWTIGIGCAGVLALVGLFVLRPSVVYRTAYAEARIATLKEACEVARYRGDLAVELTPLAQMRDGFLRAQMAHEIETELHQRLKDYLARFSGRK